MHAREWIKSGCASLMIAALFTQPLAILAEDSHNDRDGDDKQIEIAPRSNEVVSKHMVRVEDAPNLTHEEKLELLQKKIKYVFVLFQENRSFDFYFGTYPGARGLFSQPASATPGFNPLPLCALRPRRPSTWPCCCPPSACSPPSPPVADTVRGAARICACWSYCSQQSLSLRPCQDADL